DKETTLEWIGPQDNYSIEYLDIDENKYPQLKGFLKMSETSTSIPFEPVYTKKYIDNFPEGIVCDNNHVLAKVNKVEKLKINDRYFLKYEYEIEKVYYGNLKKGDKVSVCMKDWTEKQDFVYLGGNPGVPYTSAFKNSVTFPRVGQYIVTRIHGYEFKEEFYPNMKEKYFNYYNNALYKNELKLMEENYFVQSHIFNQMLFDENKNIISTGAVMLDAFRKYKNDETATIEKLSAADEFIKYFFVTRE
ncbi:MAG: hypothetical protein IKZ25_05560, partial [Clostridia bacterium]|nr:hypothetical protein [Clostridia bacterium]